MQTSQEWWQETKNDPAKLNAWLLKQYRGETEASWRVGVFADVFVAEDDDRSQTALSVIEADEYRHSLWIKALCISRGLDVEEASATDRYWDKTNVESIGSFEQGCAIGAHAEKMRLERIKVIAEDETAPEDIRAVFQKILPDEIRHEEFFRTHAGVEALAAELANHEEGVNALGLVM